MGQVLYRKYRSRSLDEIVGQEHITTTLKNALKQGAISHAYLFTGPRGVGKTSIARILAHELNELPYDGEDMHLDIIEIDAASNRGIDEIRELREKVQVAPANGKYKVYIIDEVHMLTTPAFNALLKTLEEPPAHVVFILATTEVHKLPATIVSRTQRYGFRPVEQAKVVAHLRHIADQEKIKIDDEALQLIAEHGEGSFRDSISLLNQAAGQQQPITAETIRHLLGLPPETALNDLFQALGRDDKPAIMQQLTQLYEQGYQAATIAKHLGQLGRSAIIDKHPSNLDDDTLLNLLTNLIDVAASPAPERLLEIVLLKTGQPAIATPAQTNVVAATIKSVEPEAKPKKTVRTIATAKTEVTTTETLSQPEPAATAEMPAQPAAVKPKSTNQDLAGLWPSVLETIKTKHNTVYGILRMSQPNFSNDTLTLIFKYAFHQKRMQEAKHRQIISDVVVQLSGQPLTIVCEYDKEVILAKPLGSDEIKQAPIVPSAANPPMTTISNIFGGGELLES